MEVVKVIAEIATPILLLYFTARFEVARRREERWRDSEMRLREDRIEIYNKILEPYVILLSKKDSVPISSTHKKNKYKNMSNEEIAKDIILSVDYRDTGFKLALFGSDGVVRAYYNLQQHSFNRANKGLSSNPQLMLRRLGNFLLEIRRSVGNEATKIQYHELLGWFITDIEKLEPITSG